MNQTLKFKCPSCVLKPSIPPVHSCRDMVNPDEEEGRCLVCFVCENRVECEHLVRLAGAPAEHRPKAAGLRGKGVQLEPGSAQQTEPA